MGRIYQYFVEGECEQKLINTYKISPTDKLLSGKVEVFNFITEEISNQRIAVLKPNTTIILVYDTDVIKMDILEQNIQKLRIFGFKKIIHIQSIRNFEDEIVFSSSLKNINECYKTKSPNEFKAKFLHQSDLISKMKAIGFDIDKMWTRVNHASPFCIHSCKEDLTFIKRK